jgi:hypothetical protein
LQADVPFPKCSLEHFAKMSIRPRLIILHSSFQVCHFGGGGQNRFILFELIFEEKKNIIFLSIEKK